MSKVVKGVFKGVKKIVKGVTKVFKKIASSKLGKIILAGVAIYTGGVLMGAWGQTGPMSGLFGKIAGGAASGAGGGAAATGGAVVAPTVAAPVTAASTAPALASTVGAGAPVVEAGAGLAGAGAGQAAPGFLSSAGNFLAQAGKSTLAYAQKNPLITSTILQGVAGALSPDEEDLMRERERIRKERFAGLYDSSNIDIGGLGGVPRSNAGGARLRDLSGVPWHQRLSAQGGA